MLPCTLPLNLNLTLPLLHKPKSQSVPFSRSHICFTFSPSNEDPINYDAREETRWLREEQRWLREEQRWLREEQRWLREESRWNAERQALLQEICSLKLRIQELELLNPVQGSDNVGKIAALLQVLKEGDLGKNMNRITDSGSSSIPLVVEATKKDEEVVIKEVITFPDNKEKVQRKAALRKGSEGDDVRAMQEALQKLGFYSGEEDMEYSSFSSGTECAVKTWQATLGAPEDGIMTAELLERLFENFSSRVTKTQEYKAIDPEKSENEAPVASITNISKVQQTVVTEDCVGEVAVSEHRVFLLGENRWEDPSRLSGSSKRTPTKGSRNRCLSCHGEGRLLCMECDGTGEPNIEEQFLDWVGEGAKCPYCYGHGYTSCDVCGGQAPSPA